MSVTPIAKVLSELGPSTAEVPLVDSSEGFLSFGKDGLAGVKAKRELEESYEKGFADGIARAKEKLDQALEVQQIEREKQEASARLSLVQESIDGLMKKLVEQQQEKALLVQSMISEVLRSLIDKGALPAAIKKIEGLVDRELDGKTGARIHISGPQPAVAEIAERLSMHDFDVEFDATSELLDKSLEVQVQIDSSVFRSRLADWKQAMEELLT